MPDNLLQTGGAGGFGAVLGALMSFFGIKGKITDVDKRIDNLTGVVMFANTCDAVHKGLNQRLDHADHTQAEIRSDIKDMLKEMRKRNGE